MGLTRKTMSLFSIGDDWRSDKERTAACTRGIRRQAWEQTKILKRQSRTQQAEGLPQQAISAAAEEEQWRLYRQALAAWEEEQWRLYRQALAEWEAQRLANTPPPTGPQIAKDK